MRLAARVVGAYCIRPWVVITTKPLCRPCMVASHTVTPLCRSCMVASHTVKPLCRSCMVVLHTVKSSCRPCMVVSHTVPPSCRPCTVVSHTVPPSAGLAQSFHTLCRRLQALHGLFTHCEIVTQVLHGLFTHCEIVMQALHGHFTHFAAIKPSCIVIVTPVEVEAPLVRALPRLSIRRL